ncbi:MAG: WhiB family transcriptional regulator [Micropruina sp.]|uniref:WhiB family transcriptional regulator n=1 Tax=Micropruina sp. TaxID=2737536 RepID=UPI0039E2D1E5
MPHSTSADRAACIDNPALFQHELLEDPALARGNGERQRQAVLLNARAGAVCADCPLFESCLYDAVVKHDVAGFVAGTTETQRTQIRAALGVTVEPEDLDAMAGVVRGGRQLNHEEVLRLRQANPHESLEVLAMRLGCSLSTVKRHMRRARAAAASEVSFVVVKPTMERVLAAFAAVVRPHRSRERRVA